MTTTSVSALISKFNASLRRDGLTKSLAQVINYLNDRLAARSTRKKWALISKSGEIQNKFNIIYNSNLWENTESVSGSGSTLIYTENLRKELPELLKRFSVKRVFDAPCGDFNWVRHLLPKVDIDYVGGDIVRPLIDSLQKKHGNKKVSFIHVDLTKDRFPNSDLMMCRDCLFHLSFADARLVLKNYVDSKIPYLLTTTYQNEGAFSNRDIVTGDFRLIDLYASPFNFPTSPLACIDDWIPPHAKRQMCLFSRAQVSEALKIVDSAGSMGLHSS